jgi:hypothetical protein
MTDKSAAVKKIHRLQKQIRKQTEAVKTQLAHELSVACDTFKTLTELGVTNIFKDPQYTKYLRILNIQAVRNGESPTTKPKVGRGRGRRASGKMTVGDAILKALESGSPMKVAAIGEKASAAKGKKIGLPSLNQTLMRLKKDGKIANPERGQYVIKK